jgi:hypothetical protein
MKYYLIVLFLAATSVAKAADPVDSAVIGKIVNDGNTKVIAAIKGQAKEISDSLKVLVKPSKTAVQNLNLSGFWTYVLCFLPILFFLALLIWVGAKMRSDNIKLADFLIDKEQQIAIKKEETKVKIANVEAKEALVKTAVASPDAIRAVIANINQVDEPVSSSSSDASQSTSRLIVFLTGITSLLIAVCITSFYFYRKSLGDQDINFSSLSTVLYGLGLGILPYGFSKIASVLK